MNKHFSEINIGRFRGLKDLYLPNLRKINVLLGDNNSGKTSLLEAIQILAEPSFRHIINICSSRSRSNFIFSDLSRLMYAFPRDEEKMSMHLSCIYDRSDSLDVFLKGTFQPTNVADILLKKEELHLLKGLLSNRTTINSFSGKLVKSYKEHCTSDDIFISTVDLILRRSRLNPSSKITEIVYLDSANFSGFDSQIFRVGQNEKYKEICVQVLRIFDDTIEDIQLLTDDLNSPIKCIKSSRVGTIPIDNYGDGVQKVVAMAGAIAKAHGGVLLIDEFETGIHAHNYNDIFNFLLKACMAYDIQLFVTTHSIEAIDELLKIDEALKGDQISFITLRKDQKVGKTLSRTLTPQEVKDDRDNFDLEVRL